MSSNKYLYGIAKFSYCYLIVSQTLNEKLSDFSSKGMIMKPVIPAEDFTLEISLKRVDEITVNIEIAQERK